MSHKQFAFFSPLYRIVKFTFTLSLGVSYAFSEMRTVVNVGFRTVNGADKQVIKKIMDPSIMELNNDRMCHIFFHTHNLQSYRIQVTFHTEPDLYRFYFS